MSTYMGKQAVVVGAGIAGLTAARALTDFFEQVIVLEGDTLPADAAPRPGTPQSKHAHALLAGGLSALNNLFPNFEQSLYRAGAVPLRISSDLHLEQPGYDPFPQRDLGVQVSSMTRPLLELTLRKRLQEFGNILFLEGCRAQEFVPAADGAAVAAVRCEQLDGRSETLQADLVIDASGHGNLSISLLKSISCPLPEESSIGIEITYATAIANIPADAPTDWKAAMTISDPPRNRRAGVILPVEGNRWLITLGGRFDQKPSADWEGFLEYSQQLRTRTIYDAICRIERPAEIALFGFKASRWRHFDRLGTFPRVLLPFGDTICRFNPIYGQGMSVAALEADLLRRLLGTRTANSDGDGLGNLASIFFAEAGTIIETPWISAAVPDFVDPLTEGHRPSDLADTLKFSAGLLKLAMLDPVVHKLFVQVQHLLKPRSAYRDPELVRRIRAVMDEA